MAAILQQLSGNPLATPIGQRIEQATDPSQPCEDWNLNMEICDMINDTDEGPKDAVRAIKRRLQQNAGKNHTVIMYTLTILETCVKNCGRRFHLLVTNKDFIQDLVKLIGPKNDPPAELQEKVLSLIQVWSDTFRGQPDLSGVVQVYNELKSKGIEFPQPNYEHMVPIHTPQRSVPVHPPHTAGHYGQPVQINPAVLPLNHVITTTQRVPIIRTMQMPIALPLADQSPLFLNEEQLAKVRAELDIVNGNCRVFDEMLNELDKSNESQSEDWDLLFELHQTCQSMQKRIVELLDRVANEEITSELLRINDDLNSLFTRFDMVQAKRSQQPLGASLSSPASSAVAAGGVTFAGTGIVGATAAAAISASQSRTEEATLIDLGDSQTNAVSAKLDAFTLDGAVGGTLEPTNVSRSITKPSQALGGDAVITDFDMFAQLRSDKKENSKQIPDIPNEQEIQEMEKWLQSQPNSGNTLANSDFERFLAERAELADRQPSIIDGIDNRRLNPAETKPKQLDDPFGL